MYYRPGMIYVREAEYLCRIALNAMFIETQNYGAMEKDPSFGLTILFTWSESLRKFVGNTSNTVYSVGKAVHT